MSGIDNAFGGPVNLLSSLTATRRRAWVILFVTLLAALAILALETPDPHRSGSSSGLPESYDSVRAEKFAKSLPSADTQTAVVVVSRQDDAPLGKEDQTEVANLAKALAPVTGGGKILGPEVSENRKVALLAIPLSAEKGVEGLEADVDAVRKTIARDRPAGLTVQVTGAPAFTVDISREAEGANLRLLAVTLAVVAILLLVTYRSPVLWLVPLIVVAAAEQVTLRLVENLLPRLELSSDESTTGITSILVFGAATNYAMLLIARYREHLRVTESRFEAMGAAVSQTSNAILASGGTVVLALLTLLLASFEPSRTLGVAAAVGVLIAMVFALLVLPSALVVCPRGLFWPLVPRLGSRGHEGRVWGRLGAAVAARPFAVFGGGMLVLAALAFAGVHAPTGLSQAEQFRVDAESVSGADTLAKGFPAGTVDPATVYTTPDAVDDVARVVAAVPGVVSATPGEQRGNVATVTAILNAEPSSDKSFALVRNIRDAVAKVPGADASVGGQEATNLDLQDAQVRDRWLLVPLILALVTLVLVVLLRSLLAPVLLVITVVGSFFASYGASWLLFDNVFGFRAVDESVPLLSFLFLVALGVDYNIFLVTRAREEAQVSGTRQGMLTALRVTGGVITSAGVLLAAVFAALGVLPIITLTQIGVIVCVGVLFDTFLVRTVIVPASAFALGRHFWWPRRGEATKSKDPAEHVGGVVSNVR